MALLVYPFFTYRSALLDKLLSFTIGRYVYVLINIPFYPTWASTLIHGSTKRRPVLPIPEPYKSVSAFYVANDIYMRPHQLYYYSSLENCDQNQKRTVVFNFVCFFFFSHITISYIQYTRRWTSFSTYCITGYFRGSFVFAISTVLLDREFQITKMLRTFENPRKTCFPWSQKITHREYNPLCSIWVLRDSSKICYHYHSVTILAHGLYVLCTHKSRAVKF